MQPRTPDDLLAEIAQVRGELLRGSAAQYEAELESARVGEVADLAFGAVMLTAEGSIPVREELARKATVAERDAAFVARAAHNRVKTKIKGLEAALVSLQAELRWAREAGA